MHAIVDDFMQGLATASFINKGMLFYCVHLENGSLVMINLGFVQFIKHTNNDGDEYLNFKNTKELKSLVENMVFCNIVQNDKKCPM